MMFRGHNSITSTARAIRLRREWRPCPPVPFGPDACPNTLSHLCMQLDGFNSIGGAKSTGQRVDNSQSVR